MANVWRITQVIQEVDLQNDAANRRVTQALLEVDVCNLGDMLRRVTQVLLEVDVLEEEAPTVWFLAAPAIDSAVMIY